MQSMLIPIFNEDFYGPVVEAPLVPKSPPSLLNLATEVIARDKLLYPAAFINSLPQELAKPILLARALIRT